METKTDVANAPVYVSRGVVFTRTKLGEPIFLETVSGYEHRIGFRDWTSQQLRDIADWMEEHPLQRKFPDGSG